MIWAPGQRLSLDPELDVIGGRESIFGRFRQQPATISEARTLPLVLKQGSDTSALTIIENMFSDLLTVSDDDIKRFGDDDTLIRKLTKGVASKNLRLWAGMTDCDPARANTKAPTTKRKRSRQV